MADFVLLRARSQENRLSLSDCWFPCIRFHLLMVNATVVQAGLGYPPAFRFGKEISSPCSIGFAITLFAESSRCEITQETAEPCQFSPAELVDYLGFK